MRRPLILATTVLVFLTLGCGGPEPGGKRPQRAIPHVYTTFYPTAWMTERIAGDKAKVICPLPDGADPVSWRPSAEVISKYQDDADLIVLNGAKLEKWVARTSLPRGRMLDTSKGFREAFIRHKSPIRHTHGGKEHTHFDIDGHVWLDPSQARQQADAIHAALSGRYPRHKEAYAAGHEALVSDLDALDAAFRGLGELAADMWIYTAHPTYAYPARRYGWRLVDLDLDPDRVPAAEELAVVAKKLKYKPGRYLWWERAPSEAVAKAIREKTGLESTVFSPCTSTPPEGDYLSVMQANLERARPAFAK